MNALASPEDKRQVTMLGEYLFVLPRLRTIVIGYKQVFAYELSVCFRLVFQEVIYIRHSPVQKNNQLVSRTKLYNRQGSDFAVRVNLLPEKVKGKYF